MPHAMTSPAKIAMPTGEADEMARADQRERERKAQTGCRVAEPEERPDLCGKDARRDDRREPRRRDRPADERQPARRDRLPPPPAAVPTLSTSAAATPSGYGRLEFVTSARRSGTLYITPRMPPIAQIANESPNGKPLHQPIMTRPGSTKMIADSVPAADATV